AGTIAAILVKEGQKVKVGETIALIATKGEKPEDVAKGAGAAREREPNGSAAGPPGAQKTALAASPPREPQDARRKPDTTAASLPKGAPLEAGRTQSRQETTQTPANRSSEDLARQAQPSRRGDGATAVAEPTQRSRVSPLARRLANEMEIDLSGIRGSGPGGRIIQRDILNY